MAKIIKDCLGNRYGVKFDTEPKKLKELRNTLQPMEKFDFTKEGLEAIGYFGDDNGQNSEYFQLQFYNSKNCWTYNNTTHDFIRASQTANNLAQKDDNPEFNLIKEFFK